MLPQDGSTIISISDCHAIVCRYRQLPDGSVVCECAANAEDLEAEAIVAVVAQGRPFLIGAHYPCPPDLAARAQWT